MTEYSDIPGPLAGGGAVNDYFEDLIKPYAQSYNLTLVEANAAKHAAASAIYSEIYGASTANFFGSFFEWYYSGNDNNRDHVNNFLGREIQTTYSGLSVDQYLNFFAEAASKGLLYLPQNLAGGMSLEQIQNGMKAFLFSNIEEHEPSGTLIFDEAQRVPTLSATPNCFLAGTEISMWPLDPDIKPDVNGLYNEEEVLAKIWKKPIEEVTPEDWVLSYDDNQNLQPGQVTRTFQNEAKIILDFHGTFVTPGHVYYRKDSKKSYPFEPLLDILRDDGVIMHSDGRQIRAATNCEVGSEGDKELWAFILYEDEHGFERVRKKKKIRLGTRFMLPNGDHFSMLEFMRSNDIELIEEGEQRGYVRFKKKNLTTLFAWTFSDKLPDPEDFVLQRSGTTLEEIYQAGEWESQYPQMPAPMVMDGGPVQPLPSGELQMMARNSPMAFRKDDGGRPSMTFSSRKERRAYEAKERKASKERKKKLH